LFFGLGAIFLYEMLWKERSLKTRWKELLPYIGTLICIFAWYSYAGHYNANNMSMVFLQGLLPIWDMNWVEMISNWKLLHSDLKPEFFHPSMIFVFIIALIGLLLNWKKTHPYLRALTVLVILGIGTYLILFFQVFNVHDYYLINLLVIVPLVTFLILAYLKKHHDTIFSSLKLKIVASGVLLFLIYNAAVRTIIKYDIEVPWVSESFIMDKEAVAYWQWYHWAYGNTYKDLETIEPYLEKLGVEQEDKVISLPDQSINRTLYLMNRNGYTGFGYHTIVGEERIENEISWGAKYLVVNDTSILHEPYLQPYIKNKIGATDHVFIYKL
ncbi:MAG: hypothetical protein ACI837_003545, partial [Crocinitomicaceae bacterium]